MTTRPSARKRPAPRKREAVAPSLVEAIQRKLTALQADPRRNEREMLESLTMLPSTVPSRQARLRELIAELENENDIDRRALVTVLWKGVRLAVDERYESAWMMHRRLSIDRRRRLTRELFRLLDELCEVVPSGHLRTAARSFGDLLRDPRQWPSDAGEATRLGEDVEPLSRPGRGNPLAVLASVVRRELEGIRVTDREVQNDLLTFVGLLSPGTTDHSAL